MITLLAPLSGVVVPLEQVPDPVFAERTVGDGIAIDPTSQVLVAPCDGRVIQIHRAGHAVTIEAGGLEILMHIGLDTVELKGQGFTPKVEAGSVVRAGDPLIAFDADFVATHARSLLTEVIVTSMDRVASIQPRTGAVAAGRDVLMSIVVRGETASAAVESGAVVTSAPVVVGVPSGLHARPAALVAARARQFTSDIRIVKNDHDANARSVVSIMALEVAGGDTVHVTARGNDATEAVAAVSAMLATALNESASSPPASRASVERCPVESGVGRWPPPRRSGVTWRGDRGGVPAAAGRSRRRGTGRGSESRATVARRGARLGARPARSAAGAHGRRRRARGDLCGASGADRGSRGSRQGVRAHPHGARAPPTPGNRRICSRPID